MSDITLEEINARMSPPPEKRWFISFQWCRRGKDYWHRGQEITDLHPIEWLYSTNNMEEEYHLLWWKELTEEDQKYIDPELDLPLT